MIPILLFALALPPITQEEAIAFHATGICAMGSIPGKGITRPDGRGWITSSIPGKHLIFAGGKPPIVIDFTPGQAYLIFAPKSDAVWCPQFTPPGRAACGPVPQAFLYEAITVTPIFPTPKD